MVLTSPKSISDVTIYIHLVGNIFAQLGNVGQAIYKFYNLLKLRKIFQFGKKSRCGQYSKSRVAFLDSISIGFPK